MKKLSASTIFIIFALGWLALFCWGIWGVAQGLLGAESNEDYCYYLSNMVYIVGALIFSCLYFIMVYLVYINKQYSKWCMWLFYVWGVASLAYFIVSGMVYDYMFDYANQENIFKMAAHARRVLTGPLLFVMICFMFIPKLIKDAMKLKEEQDLTI
jgi:hypothetical protein